jgi:CRP/FNR family transcriptional regulator, cyclic AMP receptor protein
MTKKEEHVFTEKRKALAARTLAQKIGYLRVQDFPSSFFDSLPAQVFTAHRIIRPSNELFVVQKGVVEIRHTHHDMLVSALEQGALFGDMSLLGQAMLGCKAIVGPDGATLAAISAGLVREWIRTDPLAIFEELGPRLSVLEAEHYRAAFQTVESRLAGLLLELAGGASSVNDLTQEELGEQLGVYRETVAYAISVLRSDRIIEVGRKRITILDKRALRELSEL